MAYAGIMLLFLIILLIALGIAVVLLVRRQCSRQGAGRRHGSASGVFTVTAGTVLIDNPSSVKDVVKNIIAEQMGIDANAIPDDETLEDLIEDQLDITEISMELSGIFGFDITEEDEQAFLHNTPVQLAAFLEGRGARLAGGKT